MAVEARDVRLEERLKIKIGEAKNLPARGHGATHRDTYCVLSLDQEEIFRTSTVERTLNPFFGEEFQFEVPRGFRYLSIYVFDRDRQYKQDKVLGKVAIRREDLEKYKVDHWFALCPVDADSEVQGKAHIEILFEDPHPKITNISPEVEVASDSICIADTKSNALTPTEETYCSQSFDRKSKTKNAFKNSSEFSRDNKKFGSCSSNSSKKLYCVPVTENIPMSLTRSESLRGNQHNAEHQVNSNMYSQSVSKNFKLSLDNFHEGAEQRSHQFAMNHLGYSAEVSHLSTELYSAEESHYVVQQPDLRNKLSVRVLECSELTLKNGQCDPCAEVTVLYKSGKKVTKRTKTRKKTVNPKFDECFVFDLILDCAGKEKESNSSSNTYTLFPVSSWADVVQEISVSLWHDAMFLGEVRLPLQTIEQRAALNSKAWYFLGSRHGPYQGINNTTQQGSDYIQVRGATPSGTQYSNSNLLGSLRLMLHHTLDRVLPSAVYDKLRSLLLKPPPYKPVTSSAVHILGELVSNKTDVAQPLVRLFTHADTLIPIIKALADAELSKVADPTTIFRGNTLVSKMMEEAMRLIGLSYLQQTLRPIIDLVLSEKKSCEIDPTRIKEPGTVEANLVNLKDYVEKTFNAITQSFIHCPAIMCRLFDALRQCATQRFPPDAGVRYSVVSGFIFLRFFAPAILGPRLFNLTTEHIDPQTSRTLTLISKTIQTLGNYVSSRSSQQPCKEEYMCALYNVFCTEYYVKPIKKFLEIISSSTETQNSNTQDAPVLLKEGVMLKKSQRKKFAFSNLKTRHFQLTSCQLSYSKARGKKPLCAIPLAEIVAAKMVGDEDLKMINMFQIVYRDRALYVQASNCVERKEWLDLLSKLCESHRSEQKQYHHMSYQFGRWKWSLFINDKGANDCGTSKEDAPGCAIVLAQSPSAGIHLRLDPSRDLQRIHCLLYNNISKIGDTLQQLKHGVVIPSIEDVSTYKATLQSLSDITFSLEDQHRAYQRSLDRETKYGSKQAPIGDDNYLQLVSRSNMDSSIRSVKHSQSESTFSHSNLISYDNNHLYHMRVTKSYPLSIITTSPKLLPRVNKMPMKTPPQIPTQQKNVSLDLDLDTSDSYLKNSLYISSSNESVQKDVNKKVGDSMENANSSENGYLKMIRHDSDIQDMSNIQYKKNVPTYSASSTSEYVYVKPNLPEKETFNVRPSTAGHPKPVAKENNSPEGKSNSSLEYDLLLDFNSGSKNRSVSDDPSLSQDVPPAIPPRSNHTAPSLVRYYKKPQLFQTNIDAQSQNLASHEHKTLEHYQLKSNKQVGDSISKDDRLNVDNEMHTNTHNVDNSFNSPSTSSQGAGSQISSDLLCKSENKNDQESDVTDSVAVKIAEITIRQDKGRTEFAEKEGAFSRADTQRKSIPIKSKFISKKTNSMDGALENAPTEATSTKSQLPLADRLTPSFLKKKTKVNTDNVRLHPIC